MPIRWGAEWGTIPARTETLVHRIGFNRGKYIQLQLQHIAERRARFSGRPYLEFGGKLIDNIHAIRVLPGFTPDNKLIMLRELAGDVEIIVVANAKDFQRRKMRADLGTTYEGEVLRQIDAFDDYGLYVGPIVITQWIDDNREAKAIGRRFERLGIRVYRHFPIPGYPNDVARIASDQSLGRNDYVETSHDLAVVTTPRPGFGEMATCLSQLYHDHKRGVSSGYAKWEVFPIWNLPIDHPVNVAYEAATADLDDVNMIDPFHLAAHGVQTVSYNRDVEIFSVLSRLFTQILGESPYQSPTDMGIDMAGLSICGGEARQDASKQEMVRRYYRALVTEKKELAEPLQSGCIALLMSKLSITGEDRPVVAPCRKMAKATKVPVAAVELADGRIILGKTPPLSGCSSAMLLNALKALVGIDPEINLLVREVIKPIQCLKTGHLGSRNPRFRADEVLITLAVSASTDENARAVFDRLGRLKGCDVHTSTILGSVDEGIFRSLGIQVANEPVYTTKSLCRKK